MPMSPRGRAVVILVATLVGTVLTGNLGAWQLRRAAQKVALQDALDTRAKQRPIEQRELATTQREALEQRYRPVTLHGHWIPERSVFLENRQMRDRVGFYVVTPFQLTDRPDAVLIQRGWVPRDQRDRTLLPPVPTPAGEIVIEGQLAPPPSRLYDLGGAESGLIRQNIDVEAFKAESGLTLAPLSVLQSSSPSTAGDGLLREWPRPAVDVQKHYGYAFQWFAICALMAGLYVWFQLVRPRLRRSDA